MNMRTFLKRAQGFYIYIASAFFAALLIVFFLNVVLGILYGIKEDSVRGRDLDISKSYFPEYSKEELNNLRIETWTRPLQYDPFVAFREKEFSGKYVNVAPQSYRLIKNQASWPLKENEINIFVFGGSTIFGYNVSDTKTIPSYLQVVLREHSPDTPVNVYNFGQAFHYSTQERAFFEELVFEGHIPDLAIFIDGVNDSWFFDNMPYFFDQFSAMLDDPNNFSSAFSGLSIVRAMRSQTIKKFVRAITFRGEEQVDLDQYNKGFTPERVFEQWDKNRRITLAVAEAHGIDVLFVWQPVPTYKYDLAYHPFANDLVGRQANSGKVYEYSADRVRELADTLWLGDIQEDVQDTLYVDAIHYTPQMNKLIGEEIGNYIADSWLMQ